MCQVNTTVCSAGVTLITQHLLRDVAPYWHAPCRKNAGKQFVNHSQTALSGKRRYLILGAFSKLQKVTISFVISVRPSVRLSARNISAPTGRILIQFGI